MPTTRAVFPSLIVLALAASCGHTSATVDAYNAAKKGGIVGNAATGNTGNEGGGANSSGGMGNVGNLQQYACTTVASQQFDSAHMAPYSDPAGTDEFVNQTLDALGQDGRATQMIGVDVGASPDYFDIERSPDYTASGLGITIRGYNYRDAGRGVNLDAGQKNRPTDHMDYATVFPAASIRAASWDMDLEKRVGEASGDETAGSLNNMLLAPCMNIIRHPYWGRTQETYGEDSYHIGRMATAYTVGLQEYVTGCAKHFAANNVEKGRSSQNAIMNEQTLREIYARHFEMVVQDGGVGCIMASYNKINGVKSTQNKHLLRDILKAPVDQGGMGYKGLVLSDWWAMPGDQDGESAANALGHTQEAVLAGLDIEVPWTLHYSLTNLAQSDQQAIREAAGRVLRQKFRFKTATDKDGWSIKAPVSTLTGGTMGSLNRVEAHENLAEEVEVKSAVLLKNGPAGMPVLPLKDAVTKIAVVGPDQTFSLISSSVPKSCTDGGQRGPCTYHFATDPPLGDRGSARVNGDPARSVGPFAGIQTEAGSTRTVTSGNSPEMAAGADAVVVVVGYTPGDEGEEYAISQGGDRHTLDLPKPDDTDANRIDQNAFVGKVLDLGKPTIILIESGSIVNLPWLTHTNQNQATVWAGYGGLRAGLALGKLIFGKANFSGKVPLAWPTQAELDKEAFKDNDPMGTKMGYFFGYREYDRRKAAGDTVNMIFPFGHGLSYSTFEYSNLGVPCQAEGKATSDAVVKFTVDIKNTSAVDGDEVAMLFVKPPAKPATITGDRPIKELKSFARVSVPAGMKKTAELPLRIKDLRHWEGNETGHWTIDSGEYTILVGKNADDAETSGIMGKLTVQGY
ncbi:MAG TPA: glycoside hydrolase family 3 N-terminal domain-containing protein [Polyangiaceae bacterium]|nr:glycoside hydrolase family 3 N-terminal domain-containing protein [Polyangiaceae bacterium]